MSTALIHKIRFALRWFLIVAVLTVILLELSLQLASLFIEKRQHQSQWLHPGRIRILTLGDSNTYGLYLKADQAYPALLEQQWNAHHPDKAIEVINLAFPGTNSSRVLKSLPDMIKSFSPDIITVMVGVNDFWMAPVNVDNVSSPVSPLQGWLRDHSRVYKLLYLLRRQAYNSSLLSVDDEYRNATFDASPELVSKWQAAIKGEGKSPFQDKPAAIHYGDTAFDIGYIFDVTKKENLSGDMKNNFKRIASIAKQSNVKLVFITYAYYEMPQKSANQQMKIVSKEENVLLINTAKTFREQCDSDNVRCAELFFPDFHPSFMGHQLLATEVETQLATLLL